jgi:hypothetical protein
LILKHRNGETGEVILSWIDRYTKFGNLDYGTYDMSSGGDGSPIPF